MAAIDKEYDIFFIPSLIYSQSLEQSLSNSISIKGMLLMENIFWSSYTG